MTREIVPYDAYPFAHDEVSEPKPADTIEPTEEPSNTGLYLGVTAMQVAELASRFIWPDVSISMIHRSIAAQEALKHPWRRGKNSYDHRIAQAVWNLDILQQQIYSKNIPVVWKDGDFQTMPWVTFTYAGYEPKRYDYVDPRNHIWRGRDVRDLSGVSILGSNPEYRIDAHRFTTDDDFVVQITGDTGESKSPRKGFW